MKKSILMPSLLVVLGALFGFPVAFAVHSVPYNGSFSGSFTVNAEGTKATLASTGHEEHLGDISNTATATSSNQKAGCTGGFTAKEQDTTTAANGDKLFSTANDVICPTSNPHVVQLTAFVTITGGTGRFADATGSATGHVTVTETSTTSGTFSGTFTGTISY